ncbi:MAG: ribosomal protein S18-alanine N-acetyltransferase [Chromatiales bacterium]|nr:MAG: ribosomal protein S18-alanine N-acetyltransferase [Chromatiales bacterium]
MSAAVEDLPPQLRPMRQEDVPAVAALEQAAYEFPWSAGIFRDCLLAGYTAVTLETDHEIVGYAVMSVAAGEAHLLNICIAPHLRRRGIARRLLQHMLELAMQSGAERLFLEVRPSNRDAMRLYRAAGFDVIGVRRGYYRAVGGNEDAVVLVRRIPDQA